MTSAMSIWRGDEIWRTCIQWHHKSVSWWFFMNFWEPSHCIHKIADTKKSLDVKLSDVFSFIKVCVCVFFTKPRSWFLGDMAIESNLWRRHKSMWNLEHGLAQRVFVLPNSIWIWFCFFPVLFEGFLVFFVFQLDVLPFFNLRNLRNSEISVVRLASKFFRSKESPEFGWTHKDGSFDQLLGEDPTKMEGLLGDECFACVSFGGVGRCYVSSRLKRGVLNKTRGRYEWSSTVLLGDVSMRFKLRGVKYIHSTQVFETYRLGVCSNFQSGSQWRQFEASMMISCPVGY